MLIYKHKSVNQHDQSRTPLPITNKRTTKKTSDDVKTLLRDIC